MQECKLENRPDTSKFSLALLIVLLSARSCHGPRDDIKPFIDLSQAHITPTVKITLVDRPVKTGGPETLEILPLKSGPVKTAHTGDIVKIKEISDDSAANIRDGLGEDCTPIDTQIPPKTSDNQRTNVRRQLNRSTTPTPQTKPKDDIEIGKQVELIMPKLDDIIPKEKLLDTPIHSVTKAHKTPTPCTNKDIN